MSELDLPEVIPIVRRLDITPWWHDHDTMRRTQVQLTDDQHRALKRWANRLGISLSEAVRRCVADRLAAEQLEGGRARLVREARSVLGKYADPSGRTDVAREHDRALDDAFE
jgi:hypothetical protein